MKFPCLNQTEFYPTAEVGTSEHFEGEDLLYIGFRNVYFCKKQNKMCRFSPAPQLVDEFKTKVATGPLPGPGLPPPGYFQNRPPTNFGLRSAGYRPQTAPESLGRRKWY